ncbi:MAG: molybdate ABC transporter permease subunit [Crocinitomicaceae bacterium]|nr:molybdate ABC transporter permease subunit [Crocinitomicaceae bacterium]
MEWSPIILTLELAVVTTLILFALSIPIAYWLASSKSPFRGIIEAIVSLPLVLPPTVLGFYLLIAFSPESWIGSFFYDVLGLRLVFSFTGLVIGSVIYSLPFMVQPLQAGISSIPASYREAASLMGKSKWQTIFKVVLPNMKSSLLTGIVLTFAHTIGEFGVVLMIGGNIPDKTKVMSIAIYDEVESLNYGGAHAYSLTLVILMFLILLIVNLRKNKSSKFLT